MIIFWVINKFEVFWGFDVREFKFDCWVLKDEMDKSVVSGGVMLNYVFLIFLYGLRSCIG